MMGVVCTHVWCVRQRELEAKMMRSGLNVVWKMGKLLLEERVRRVCEIMMSAVDRCGGGAEEEHETRQEMHGWMDACWKERMTQG